MPTYDFVCRDCGAQFELVASLAEYERMKRDRGVRCTACGGERVAPQIVTFEVQTVRKTG
jgi:putative FmdB family regulatory protein